MQPVRQIREMMALVMLAISAYTDIKERSIYIIPIVVPALGAVVILLISHISVSDGGDFAIVIDLIIPVVIGILMIPAKAHIGVGDIYLVVSLGIVAGTIQGLTAVLAGSVMSAVYAMTVKLSGKKTIKNIPFAPFVMAGFLFVLINNA